MIPTFSSISSEPGTSIAAAIKNAAEDISEGTSISFAKSSLHGFMVTLVLVEVKFAPNFFNISSVWSLDFAGSVTVVGLDAYNPASSIADFTCALATGELYSIPCSLLPVIVSGANPSLLSISAPIIERGVIIRFIGLFCMDLSPVSIDVKFCAESIPLTSLVVVPLLPQSSISCGQVSP